MTSASALASFFFPRLGDKIWEWPGNEATSAHVVGLLLYASCTVVNSVQIACNASCNKEQASQLEL